MKLGPMLLFLGSFSIWIATRGELGKYIALVTTTNPNRNKSIQNAITGGIVPTVPGSEMSPLLSPDTQVTNPAIIPMGF